jgi:hypothetical protein
MKILMCEASNTFSDLGCGEAHLCRRQRQEVCKFEATLRKVRKTLSQNQNTNKKGHGYSLNVKPCSRPLVQSSVLKKRNIRNKIIY